MYSTKQLGEIKSKIINKITVEIDLANDSGTVDEVLDKYGIVYEPSGTMPINTRTMKILVFGALSGNVRDYQSLIKKMGIEMEHVVFENDYERLTNYSVTKLRNSVEYSDILYGPVPHSQKNMWSVKSFLQEIKNKPLEYPKLIEMIANDKIKITKSNFESAIKKTRYFQNIS